MEIKDQKEKKEIKENKEFLEFKAKREKIAIVKKHKSVYYSKYFINTLVLNDNLIN